MDAETVKVMKRYGTPCGADARGRKICRVTCTVCGKEIRTDQTDKGVGYSLTQRHTAVFWHAECEKDVWNSRMR